jgi:hypothetical protein
MNKSKMTALSRQMHAEAVEIEQIQAQITEQQRRVAYAALLRCCAVIIQTLWRGTRGRQKAKRIKRQRALLVICRRWLYSYRRRQLVRVKASLARCCLRHRYRRHRAARDLQRVWRGSRGRRAARFASFCAKALDAVLESVLHSCIEYIILERCVVRLQRCWRRNRAKRPGSGKKKKGGKARKKGTQAASRTSQGAQQQQQQLELAKVILLCPALCTTPYLV